ncbi:pseudouridine synthase [Stutzerimonas nosocomialis]|uniref:Pseudouridine synthase n=1 Tax=Stutzerimonas nosocomialis TaxID=1056496 RepID=A0A5R9QDE0_9GAMM|nr:YqcC family protein [Stutzerimonas nosocomialis]TLX62918.1 pseudouridine synthase [Stutzerimonas nosocomialis]
MDARIGPVADQLLLIERELRLLGLWASEPPAAEALASREPFCVDTLKLEEWLQWIFLPRMKLILEQGQPLPRVSGIKEMAEEVYRQQPQEVAALIGALADFDRLIMRAD